MASTIISATHQRIEEIIPLVVAATFRNLRVEFEQHISCSPRSYHVTFGNSDADGEVVSFERYCKCGVINGRLSRASFESDTRLADWSKSEKERHLKEEAAERETKYQRYLELKEEFGFLDIR